MSDQNYYDVEHIKPAHPGFLIENLLMKNYMLTKEDIAERMGTSPERMTGILDGSERFTLDDAKNLKKHFGHAAINLMRIQVSRDFFEQNGRRANDAEREKLFATCVL